MKKGLAILAMVLMFCGNAFAAPFLVCDPNPRATVYVLEVDGVEQAEAACLADGSFKHDMAAWTGGNHTVKAKVGNVWGWSVYSDPFNFNADVPGVPSGFGFSAD